MLFSFTFFFYPHFISNYCNIIFFFNWLQKIISYWSSFKIKFIYRLKLFSPFLFNLKTHRQHNSSCRCLKTNRFSLDRSIVVLSVTIGEYQMKKRKWYLSGTFMPRFFIIFFFQVERQKMDSDLNIDLGL